MASVNPDCLDNLPLNRFREYIITSLMAHVIARRSFPNFVVDSRYFNFVNLRQDLPENKVFVFKYAFTRLWDMHRTHERTFKRLRRHDAAVQRKNQSPAEFVENGSQTARLTAFPNRISDLFQSIAVRDSSSRHNIS